MSPSLSFAVSSLISIALGLASIAQGAVPLGSFENVTVDGATAEWKTRGWLAISPEGTQAQAEIQFWRSGAPSHGIRHLALLQPASVRFVEEDTVEGVGRGRAEFAFAVDPTTPNRTRSVMLPGDVRVRVDLQGSGGATFTGSFVPDASHPDAKRAGGGISFTLDSGVIARRFPSAPELPNQVTLGPVKWGESANATIRVSHSGPKHSKLVLGVFVNADRAKWTPNCPPRDDRLSWTSTARNAHGDLELEAGQSAHVELTFAPQRGDCEAHDLVVGFENRSAGNRREAWEVPATAHVIVAKPVGFELTGFPGPARWNLNPENYVVASLAWNSSTGDLSDLTGGTVVEDLRFGSLACKDGEAFKRPAPWRITPPFACTHANRMAGGEEGTFADAHGNDENLIQRPYVRARWVTHQFFHFHAPWLRKPIQLAGPWEILREVRPTASGWEVIVRMSAGKSSRQAAHPLPSMR